MGTALGESSGVNSNALNASNCQPDAETAAASEARRDASPPRPRGEAVMGSPECTLDCGTAEPCQPTGLGRPSHCDANVKRQASDRHCIYQPSTGRDTPGCVTGMVSQPPRSHQ